MQNLIVNLFQKRFECTHQNALVNENEGYCQDCGAYLKKYFYIIRCSCCEIKREGSKKFNDFAPKTKYCKNCGGQEFYVERHNNITFIDIRYAIHSKEILKDCAERFSQIWIDDEDENNRIESTKLIENKV